MPKKKVEQLPEEEGLPPHAHDMFFGHEKIERDMRDLLTSRRLHHAWLIEGPRGLGKATSSVARREVLAGRHASYRRRPRD